RITLPGADARYLTRVMVNDWRQAGPSWVFSPGTFVSTSHLNVILLPDRRPENISGYSSSPSRMIALKVTRSPSTRPSPMTIGGSSASLTVPVSVAPAVWNSIPTGNGDLPVLTHLPESGDSAARRIDPLKTTRATRNAFIGSSVVPIFP